MSFQEKEVKFYIQDLSKIADRLRVCGAEKIRPRMLEKNMRLDTEDQTLQKGDRLLRIRQDDKVRITYKDNAKTENGVVTRTEIELTCDDFNVTRKLFEVLGYKVTVMYEKYRCEYRIGDAVVFLDEMPFGNFLEIEAPNNALIEGVAQMLSLDWSKSVGTNYLGLFQALKEKLGLEFNDLSFTNFEGLSLSPADLGVVPADQ
jgi:adenylate cyclase, class 2